MLSLDTAYRSFGGEVEASSTPTICRLPDSRRHQLSAIARTKPKLAVYSHIVLPNALEQDLIPPTRKTYSGPLELGEDLMVIEVGESVEVRRPIKP
jgi:hypothetical protein